MPLGGFLTHRLLHADPRKIVAVRAGIPVDHGNHRAPGHRPANRPPVVVHHFKWRHGVRDYLQQRAEQLTAGRWTARTPAMRNEARRLLDHLNRHDGRIATNSSAPPMRPVHTAVIPHWWQAEATRIVESWRPPRPQNDPAATTCSPSPAGGSNRA